MSQQSSQATLRPDDSASQDFYSIPLDPNLLQSIDFTDGNSGSLISSSFNSMLDVPSNATDNDSESVPTIFMAKRKLRKSWVYNSENGEEYIEANGRTRWRCLRCRAAGATRCVTFSDSSTKNMIEHLRDIHKIGKNGPLQLAATEQRIRTAFGNTLPRITFNLDIFQQLLLRWIVLNNISFRQVEQPSFKALLKYLCACSPSYIAISRAMPSSAESIRQLILNLFKSAQLEIIDAFNMITTAIHFTFDLWTSPNHRAFLGVVAHWVHHNGQLMSTVIGLRRFKGRHSGENQASHFWQIICDYNITRKIGYFTLDNASNNDTTMMWIGQYLKNIGIEFDPVGRRLGCFGHVINLVVKAFLWGENAEAFENEMASYQELKKEELELLEWRKRGPLGKLHNLLTWIGRSPQRRDRFEEKVRLVLPSSTAVALIHGNDTRWGGDYDSITRAFELREPLEEFIATAIRNNLDGEKGEGPSALKWDELSTADWEDLHEILDVLTPFRKWQLALQGKAYCGALHEIYPAMDELLSHLETTRARYQSVSDISKHLLTSINTAWAMLNKYYALTDLAPIHLSAIALHPEMKLDYFEVEWEDRPAWIKNARAETKKLWQNEYKSGPPVPHESSAIAAPVSPHYTAPYTFTDIPEWKRKKRARIAADTMDEFERFQQKDCEEDLDISGGPLQYWIQRRNDSRQRSLAHMGIEIHSIPAMSADPERLFSSSKLLISDRRNRLGDDIIEASECLKSWVKEGLVFSKNSSDIDQMETMLQDLEMRAIQLEKKN